MGGNLELPVVDLSSEDRDSTAKSIRHACLEYGFFYLVNHGIGQEVFDRVFEESKKFFSLPECEKMKLERNQGHRGYTPPFAEKLDPSSQFKGDPKESFYIGSQSSQNQWPSEETLPCWREAMVSYYEKVLVAAKRLIQLIALALDLDEDFFERLGCLWAPDAVLRLLHYPGKKGLGDPSNQAASGLGSCYGASAHSDYGMITLLVCDGVPGLQICREKDKQPNIWEDVCHLDGAFIVNVGDMLERWTNCLFRSTLHRVMTSGQERYSIAFFMEPNPDCLVKCLDSCCNETNPPKFPPVRSGDYLKERFRLTYG